MSLTARVLVGLIAGMAGGIMLSRSATTSLPAILAVAEPVGTLWINAIRMTVLPLVVSSLITGVAGASDIRTIGRIGWRAIVIFFAVLFAGTIFAALVGQPVLAWLTIDPAAIQALRESAAAVPDAAARASTLPGFTQWLVDLVPTNPVKAAADGALLPLIVFTLAFAAALLRIEKERRASIVAFFTGVFDAMLTLVRWVLALAPIGVFALALALAARLGIAAAGALALYVLLVSVVCVVFGVLVLYPAAIFLGRVPLRRFARASAPAQAVAFSSRSSLAALPAMIDGASRHLGLPNEVSQFFIPLAASIFRAGAGIGMTIGVLFVARLYGITLSTTQLATVVLTIVLTSFSIPGIPGGSILMMVPVMLAAGLPVEGVAILLGIDTIPDMFRTTVNVTGHMAAATIVSREQRKSAGAQHPTSTPTPTAVPTATPDPTSGSNSTPSPPPTSTSTSPPARQPPLVSP